MFVRCQMSDVCHVSLTLSCISSVIKYQKWIHLFLPQPNGFCQVTLLSINCANMQNCFCNVDSTDLPKPSSANLPHLLSIYAEMVPRVCQISKNVFCVKVNQFRLSENALQSFVLTSFSQLGRPHPKQKQNGTVGVVKDLDLKLV